MNIKGVYTDPHRLDGTGADNHKGIKPRYKTMLVFAGRKCTGGVYCAGDDKDVTQAQGETIQEKLESINIENADTLKMEKRIGVKKVCGNHDEGTIPLKRIEEEIEGISPAGDPVIYKWIVSHGHEFDKWCSKFWFAGAVATKIVGWLERKGFWNAERMLSKLFKKVADRNKGRDADKNEYFESMKKEIDGMKLPDDVCVVWVIGHTHKKIIKKYGRHLLIQAGRCSSGAVQLFMFDPDTGKGSFKSF